MKKTNPNIYKNRNDFILSKANRKQYENGITCTIEQIMKHFHFTEQEVINAMKELEKFGYIKIVKRGLGEPDIIYVKQPERTE